jgi:hypothetical protein
MVHDVVASVCTRRRRLMCGFAASCVSSSGAVQRSGYGRANLCGGIPMQGHSPHDKAWADVDCNDREPRPETHRRCSFGAGACPVGMCLQVFLFRPCRIVFIESFCRVASLSMSGLMLYAIVDEFVVQWPQLDKTAAESATNGWRGVKYIGRLC